MKTIARESELSVREETTAGLQDVFDEILAERHRQDEKWGVQDHPSVDPTVPLSIFRRMLEIPTSDHARDLCNQAFTEKRPTWAHVLVEELCETVDAATEEDREEELIQVAAVAVAWLQNIRRRRAMKSVQPPAGDDQ